MFFKLIAHNGGMLYRIIFLRKRFIFFFSLYYRKNLRTDVPFIYHANAFFLVLVSLEFTENRCLDQEKQKTKAIDMSLFMGSLFENQFSFFLLNWDCTHYCTRFFKKFIRLPRPKSERGCKPTKLRSENPSQLNFLRPSKSITIICWMAMNHSLPVNAPHSNTAPCKDRPT